MLRSSRSSSGQRFPFAPPGRSRWQEGVLLQGHPRPWPFAKLRTLWVPAHKVQGTKTDNAVLAFYLAFSLGGARASCHLRHSVPDKEAVHVRVAPVGGFLVLHSRAGSARRQRPGSRQSRQPRLRRRSSKVSRHGGRLVYPRMLFLQPLQAVAGGATCRSFRASVVRPVGPLAQRVSVIQPGGPDLCPGPYPVGAACHTLRRLVVRFGVVGLFLCSGNSACERGPFSPAPNAGASLTLGGPFRPGPWRPSAFRTGRRSLSASGSLRSPVRGPAKAHRPQAYVARPPPRPYPPLRFGALLV